MSEDNVRHIAPTVLQDTCPNAEDHHRDRLGSVRERHARALILRTLDAQPGYCMNSRVLQHVLDDWALGSTHDALKEMLAWLGQEQLIALRPMEDAVIATLRERGADVVSGRILHEQVERPLPSA